MRQKRIRGERTTLLDVATKAGVSAITVSRALREPDRVSEALRERILRVVEETGYVPDYAARALASRHNGIVCALLPEVSSLAVLNIIHGIEARLQETELRIQYANAWRDPEKERRQLELFLSQHPAGILVAGGQNQQVIVNMVLSANCPIVHMIDTNLTALGTVVGSDHCSAAKTATQHLLDCGYRRIAILGGGVDLRVQRRLEGYRVTLEAHGLYDPQRVMMLAEPTSVPLGCRMLGEILERQPDIDAVFCLNDDVALGAFFECKRRGIRVPEDFGICGYNDVNFAAVAEPPLTTVRIPRYDMGYRATDLLIRQINGEKGAKQSIDLGFELMVRGTTRSVAENPALPS
ncbi:LacI family DNA-binding transcriptional regulator [Neorhizobium sp. NPDC001467]|uniref:LacI family DNA-binding transcriptional regulator n=1 Tax=Neorhizobium sp. NPDC001467 TaxID=3390595 RepID=UPI003CFF9108